MSWDIFSKSKIQYFLEKLKDKFVQKETGKGLSTNDYTTNDKNKLAGIAAGATKTASSTTNGNIKINDVETQVYDDSEIQDKIDETTTSISGNPISISGLKANQLAVNPIITLEPIQDLHGQSKPYPAGGGKNKLPLTIDGIKAENTDGTWSGNVYTSNGVTFTILVDNANNVIGINISGTSSASGGSYLYLKRSFSVTANSVLNGCPSGGSSNTYRLSMSGVGSDVGAGVNVPANSTGNVYILRGTTSVSGTVTFKPMVRLATVTDSTFAPYENICPISGYDKIEVLSCGVNVWDEVWELGELNAQGQNASSTTKIRSKNYIPVVGGSTYYLKLSSASAQVYICFYDVNKTFISSNTPYQGTFTVPLMARYCRFNCPATYGTTYNNDMGINYPATQTSYVASNKATSISESLGQTVYGGTLDVRTGVLKSIEKANYITLDGTANWGMQTSGSNKRFYVTGVGANINESSTDHICNMALVASGNNASQCYTVDDRFALYTTSNGTVYLSGNIASDVTALKALLNTTPLQICYTVVDSAEKTIQLTPHEISLLKDYAYVSTNGTSIALDYHNGELASLGDVSQLGETVNELANGITYTKATVVANGVTGNGNTYQSFVMPCGGLAIVRGSNTVANLGVRLLGTVAFYAQQNTAASWVIPVKTGVVVETRMTSTTITIIS